MTMLEFTRLNEMEKVSIIMESGILLARNTGNGLRVFIYRLEGFFVSASYSITDDRLVAIHCFIQRLATPGFREQLAAVNPAERQYDTPEA